MKRFALIAVLLLLGACGSRAVWEPENENVARYGSWTDEALILSSTLGAIFLLLDQHPASRNVAVAIRTPHDPESYTAAALLADELEQQSIAVSWTGDDVAPASSGSLEIWEVATTIRGAVTLPTENDDPPFRRQAMVELRVSASGAAGRLRWNARAASLASRPVNLYFPNKKVLPDAR